MKIAILHYHLKSGGVTTVIRHQIKAVESDCNILVLTGEPPLSSSFPADYAVIPGLGYDSIAGESSPYDTAERVMAAMYEKWGAPCDVLHVHNPTLAKNKHFLNILNCLKKNGISLFLQIHDFAEDGRPNAYFREDYPENCHYGVINSRDYTLLLESGLNKKGLHKVVNMVTPLDAVQENSQKENMILYPVRAIRRKNIGEAFLLSLFFKYNESLAITLQPNSPLDMAVYKDWKAFASQHGLNIEFEASGKREFTDLVRVSKYMITTSITEGFGFSFLEPWTGFKMLWGRKLPDICIDFEQNNVNLDGLYSTIIIPIDLINKQALFERWRSAFAAALEKFGISSDPDTVQNDFNRFIRPDGVDFGLLDETFQKQIILKVMTSKKTAAHLVRANPFLADVSIPENTDMINQNRTAILENYNREAYRHNLLHIYQKVGNVDVHHKINKSGLIRAFMNPSGFSLLKWSDYENR